MLKPRLPNIEWIGDARTGHLRLLDQRALPTRIEHLQCTTVQHVWDAIKTLAVRGAPAIGVAAAYGCVVAAQQGDFDRLTSHLATSRPTAVNLFWAIDRMKRLPDHSPDALLAEARRVHDEDAAMCQAIGEHGQAILRRVAKPGQPVRILTHCNAGALATGGIGTATAPMYLAHAAGIPVKVYADETRPLLQGARLTSFELHAEGVDVTLICDNMAAVLMREGRIDLVIVGADRITANGDAANKIGTYGVAVLAKHHGVPFCVAAPSSTFDLSRPRGADIPIEERDPAEITHGFGRATAPDGVKTWNPAFDYTPAPLITALITEKGLIEPVTTANVAQVVGAA